MATPDTIPDLQYTKPDGSPYTRVEMEQQMRDVWPKVYWLRIKANKIYGLPKQPSFDMKEAVLRHWVLDEMVRRGQVFGNIVGVNVQSYNDENEVRQFTQRLSALIQAGEALPPKEGEGIDMNQMPPQPPGPPNGAQGFVPPPPPTMGQPQQGFAPPPPAAAPQGGFQPQQGFAPQGAPPPPPQGPQQGFAPVPPGYAQPPGPPMGPPGATPPPGPPQGPPAAAAPQAQPGGRRRGGKAAESAPAPQAAPVPPMPVGPPQGFAPPPPQGPPQGFAPQVPQQAPMPAPGGFPLPGGVVTAPQNAAVPAQVDLGPLTQKIDALTNLVNQQAQAIARLERQNTIAQMALAVIGRAAYQRQGAADLEGFLKELQLQLPQ